MNRPFRDKQILHLIAPPLPPARSHRARLVARWFGLRCPDPGARIDLPGEPFRWLIPPRGQILLVSGPSGAGKSRLLNAISSNIPAENRIELNLLPLPDRPLVDCFGRLSVERVLELLSRVGLAEAWTYLRTPAELSEGQRWRLRLALALHQIHREKGVVLLADEFCATLDRVTAAAVAHALRRSITQFHTRAILATSHEDLLPALRPDLLIKCDFFSMSMHRPGLLPAA